MIPARIGSERLKYKNLRILAGKPVIYYAIEAAKTANIFENILHTFHLYRQHQQT